MYQFLKRIIVRFTRNYHPFSWNFFVISLDIVIKPSNVNFNEGDLIFDHAFGAVTFPGKALHKGAKVIFESFGSTNDLDFLR